MSGRVSVVVLFMGKIFVNFSVLLRRNGVEETTEKLRGASGQLSVSHDSIFPGEVAHSHLLSSLDTLATLQVRHILTY